MPRGKPFQKGNPGGPGRPQGSRNKLETDFLDDFYAEWKEGGREALATMRADSPNEFVKVAASLLPRNVKHEGEIKHTWLDVLKSINDQHTASHEHSDPVEEQPGAVRH